MSWNGFKKGLNRTGTKILMKAGQYDRTIDRQFETEERRYRTLESAGNKLQKESKGFLDSLRAMTAAQTRIANTIDAFYNEAGTRDDVAAYYRQAVEDLDTETVKDLDGPFRETVLDPITRFSAYFPNVNAGITKRNHKLIDYDGCRGKVEKLTDKPAKDPTKLPAAEREMQMAKEIYEALNDQLTEELPLLIDLRVPYLDPSFEALVKILIRFCEEGYNRIAQVQQYIDASIRDEYAEGRLDARVEEVLEEMKSLEIASLGASS